MAGTVQTGGATRKGGGSRLWMLGLLSGAVATLATPSAVLLTALLAPCIAVCLLDTRPGRPTLRPVMLCGLAATIHPVVALWQGGHTMQVCMSLAGNSTVLATAWAAQAAAWLLAELAPIAIRLALDGQSLARATALRMSRHKYEQDWGFPATSDVSAATVLQPATTLPKPS